MVNILYREIRFMGVIGVICPKSEIPTPEGLMKYNSGFIVLIQWYWGPFRTSGVVSIAASGLPRDFELGIWGDTGG